MGIKDILKNGATAINNVTKELKPYSTVIYVIIFIIIVAIFISFFSKAISNKLLNAYTGFTIIFAIWSFFSIAIDLLVDDGKINYGYVVSFVINAILGMITLYTIGKMKIFQTIVAFFIMTLIFLVWLTDTKGSDDATKNIIEKDIPNATKGIASSISEFFNPYNVGDKLTNMFNGFGYITGWWDLAKVVVCVLALPFYIIMVGIWFCTACFELLKYGFDKIAGASSSSLPTNDAANEFISANSKDTIKWTAILLLFMIVILILFSSQSAMRKNPMGVFGIGIFISIIVLGYVRFFKLESFTSTFLSTMCALFVLYLYLYNPYNIFDKMTGVNLFAVFLLFFGIVCMLLMVIVNPDDASKDAGTTKKTFQELFDNYSKKPATAPKVPTNDDSKLSYSELFAKHYMKLIKGVIGLIVSIGLIMFLIASIGSLQSSDNNPTAGIYILNTLIVVGMLTIMFNIIDANYKIRDNAKFKLLIEIIFYIPCLLSDLADLLMTEYYKTKYFTLILVVLEIIFIIFYWFMYSKIVKKVYSGGGKVLVNEPVSLNKENTIGYYRSLSGKSLTSEEEEEIKVEKGSNYGGFVKRVNTYKFGISCWLYLNPMPSYGNAPLTILDYGNNPKVSYSPQKNELTVNVVNKNEACSETSETISVYTNKNPPIQKWFNLILNYDGGHLDVFLDSALVQTSTEVISCVNYDALKIGDKNGYLNAKLCNFIYFKTPLDILTVHNMYNITKIQDTPDIPKRDLFSI